MPAVTAAPPGVTDDAIVDTVPPSADIEGTTKGRALRYSLNRRRDRRRQLALTIWLLVAVIVLAGLLVWVLAHGTGQASARLQGPRAHLVETCQSPYVAAEEDVFLWEASAGPMTG
jgi:hypothetical protein